MTSLLPEFILSVCGTEGEYSKRLIVLWIRRGKTDD